MWDGPRSRDENRGGVGRDDFHLITHSVTYVYWFRRTWSPGGRGRGTRLRTRLEGRVVAVGAPDVTVGVVGEEGVEDFGLRGNRSRRDALVEGRGVYSGLPKVSGFGHRKRVESQK